MTDQSDLSGEEPEARTLEALSADRRKKRDVLADHGIDPYPHRFDRTATAAELHARHGELGADVRTGETVRMAGRLTSIRGHGRLSFATLQDVTGSVQLLMQDSSALRSGARGAGQRRPGRLDRSGGRGVTSRRGELSVDVVELWLLSKALRPLPDKWHGLTATDTRYRQREVDLLANADSRRVFDIRISAVAALRRQLVSEDFVEVDTPILQPQAGGALARPFMTHANALDIDLSLRIAPELYLKRLVVGGYERVFEIARNFRNEGVDTRHSPEFTALEAYRAFGDVTDGIDLTERLIVEAARAATGRLSFSVGERSIDLTPPWPRRSLLDWLEEVVGRRLHPSDPVDDVRSVCERFDVDYLPQWDSGKLIFELYDTVLLPKVVDPVFVCGFPVSVSPLARQTQGRPDSRRPLPAGHRRQGVRQRLQRAEHPRGAAGAVPGRGRGRGPRRPRGPSRRCSLRAGAGVRAPPDVGDRHRRRPPGHVARRGRGHPGRDPLSDDATRGQEVDGVVDAGDGGRCLRSSR